MNELVLVKGGKSIKIHIINQFLAFVAIVR